MLKFSYPNEAEQDLLPEKDVKEWLDIAQYFLIQTKQNGMNRNDVLKKIVQEKNWNFGELQAFLNWMKFYEEGGHLKYKKASEEDDREFVGGTYGGPGYFLPGKQVSAQNVSQVASEINPQQAAFETANQRLNDIKGKIISRLNAAENIVINSRSTVNPNDITKLLESLHTIKRQVLGLNKIASAQRVYEDFVHREINKLNNRGFYKSAELIGKIVLAQGAPIPAPPPSPVVGGGLPGAPTAGSSPMPLPGAPSGSGQEDLPESKGIKGLFDGLSIDKSKDESKDDDSLVVDELLGDDGNFGDDGNMMINVDLEPTVRNGPMFEQAVNKASELLKLAQAAGQPIENKDYDQLLDSVLNSVTINDVIKKLEDISSVFKHREVPRQLAIVDLMLEKLNLSSYFPALAEAANKAIESNQYIFNRVEEVLSRLKGSVVNENIELAPTEAIRQNLETLEQNKQNKEIAKVKEQIKGPETESVNLGELSPPPPEAAASAPAAPAEPAASPAVPPGPPVVTPPPAV